MYRLSVNNSSDLPINGQNKEETDLNSTSFPQVTLISTDQHSDFNSSYNGGNTKSYGQKIESFIDWNPVTITMSIVTLYALFGDDIKTLGFPKSDDDIFSSLVVVCLILFSLELLLSFFFKPNYKWSFYFWLDLIATLSLVTDIGWIWDSAIGVSTSSSNAKQVQNAAKASRAGTKTARALRIIRIVRLIRIVKLYKNANIALAQKKKKAEENDEEYQEIAVVNESKVGKKMSEVTMKRLIVIVLTLLFILPLLDSSFYYTEMYSWDFGVSELESFLNDGGFDQVKDRFLTYHEGDLRPVVYLEYTDKTGTFTWESDSSYTSLRYNEIYFASSTNVISIFDLRYDTKLTSLLNIFMTIFVCIVLTLGAIYFTKDSEDLVIKPIEKMIERVKVIAKNPIAASEAKAEDNEVQTSAKKCFGLCKKNPVRAKEYETQILENTIIKIGVLLALGFGEAGSVIIGSNVEKGGEVDPMANGNKIVGIFGFCDIRNFTDTTEELQEGVMVFVNEIAQIVHGVVDKYMGAANKNIGDAFLLVWKFSPDEFYLDEEENIIRNPESLRAKYIPDLSLMSFLKILAKVNKDPAMLKYRTNQKLLLRMPNYEVKMGFGMHLGTAIEGAIGSQFKIDASYLSPNVNVASALEGSTKIYGVPLLISGTLFDIFSEDIKKYCRLIDTVTIKGNSSPVRLYTSDCDLNEFVPSKGSDRSKQFFRTKRKILRRELDKKHITSGGIFKSSNEISLMRRNFTDEFYQKFDIGLKSYLRGSWGMAKEELEEALKAKPRDGPSISLLNYMSDFGFLAPENWMNSRPI